MGEPSHGDESPAIAIPDSDTVYRQWGERLSVQLVAADLPLTCLELHRELEALGRPVDSGILLPFALSRATGTAAAAPCHSTDGTEPISPSSSSPKSMSLDVLPLLVADYLRRHNLGDAADAVEAKLVPRSALPLQQGAVEGTGRPAPVREQVLEEPATLPEEPSQENETKNGDALNREESDKGDDDRLAAPDRDEPAGEEALSFKQRLIRSGMTLEAVVGRGEGSTINGTKPSAGSSSPLGDPHTPHTAFVSSTTSTGVGSSSATTVGHSPSRDVVDTLRDRHAKAEARHLHVVRTLGDRLPTLMEGVQRDRKESVIPLVLVGLEHHPQAGVRRSLLYHLLHLYRRPNTDQRQAIGRALQALADTLARTLGGTTASASASFAFRRATPGSPTPSAGGGIGTEFKSRIEEEIVGELLPLLNHRYSEMRCLGLSIIPLLARHFTESLRTLLVTSVLVPHSADSSSTVRAQVASSLPCCWQGAARTTDDVVLVLLRLILDAKQNVAAAAEAAVPEILQMAQRHELLFKAIVPAIVAALIRADIHAEQSQANGNSSSNILVGGPGSGGGASPSAHRLDPLEPGESSAASPGGAVMVPANPSTNRSGPAEQYAAQVRTLSELLHRALRIGVRAAAVHRDGSEGEDSTPGQPGTPPSLLTTVDAEEASAALADFAQSGLPALWQAGLQAVSDRVRDSISVALSSAAVSLGPRVANTLRDGFDAEFANPSAGGPADATARRRALRMAVVVYANVPSLAPALVGLLSTVARAAAPWTQPEDTAACVSALSRLLAATTVVTASGGVSASGTAAGIATTAMLGGTAAMNPTTITGTLHVLITEDGTAPAVRFMLRVLVAAAQIGLREGGHAVGIVWPLFQAALQTECEESSPELFLEVAETAINLSSEMALHAMADELFPSLFRRVETDGPTGVTSWTVLGALASTARKLTSHAREVHVLPHLLRVAGHVAGSQPEAAAAVATAGATTTTVVESQDAAVATFRRDKSRTIRSLLAVLSAFVSCASIGFHAVNGTILPALRAIAKDVEQEPPDVRSQHAALLKTFLAMEAKTRPKQGMSFFDKVRHELSSIVK